MAAATNTAETTFTNADPFASQRAPGDTPFTAQHETTPTVDVTAPQGEGVGRSSVEETDEWDASKVPPSQFQRRKGSIYNTPSSKDSHHGNKERDKAYHEKLKEKGWNLLGKKS